MVPHFGAMKSFTFWAGVLTALLLCACGDDTPPASSWETVEEGLPGALLSVWGSASDDIWTVGADARDGSGPVVLHYDGVDWTRVDTGQSAGSLWWVFGFAGGPIYMGGEGGMILRTIDGTTFEPMTTPGTNTVFGIWGASADDVWAVGGSPNANGFAWRLRDGMTWEEEPSVPSEISSAHAIWKVFGTSASDLWLVGEAGVGLHWDGSTLSQEDTGVGSSLFTVHAHGGRYAAVGGSGNGIIVELDDTGWHNVTPSGGFVSGLSGVCLGPMNSGYAVGAYGSVFSRSADGWTEVDTGLLLDQNLHGVWIDPSGGVWAAGGQTLSASLDDGVLIHRMGEP